MLAYPFILLAVTLSSQARPLAIPTSDLSSVSHLIKRSPRISPIGPLQFREVPSFVASSILKGSRGGSRELGAAYQRNVAHYLELSSTQFTKALDPKLGPRKSYQAVVAGHRAAWKAEDMTFKEAYHKGGSDHFAHQPASDARGAYSQVEVDALRQEILEQAKKDYKENKKGNRKKGSRSWSF